jgi:hypothetical protein
LLVIFVLLNGLLFGVYHGRTYPNTTVGGKQLGSVTSKQLNDSLKKLTLLPTEITFTQAKTTAKATVADLGITVDYERLQTAALQERSWLPILNLVQKHAVALELQQAASTTDSVLTGKLAVFDKAATNAQITWKDTAFITKADVAGQKVNPTATRKQLLNDLSQGKTTIQVVTTSIPAAVTTSSLKEELLKLNKQAQTSISLQYNGQVKKLTSAEVAALYAQDSPGLKVSDSAITTIVTTTGTTWGIVVDNQAAAIIAIKSALDNQKDVSFTLIAAPKVAKTIHFCTSVRGVSESLIPELDAKLASTYADSRGWGLGGLIRFEKSTSNCELHVWLSSADQMSSFGSICDSMWSCTVNPSVIINYDRWTQTSPAWKASGGSLEDYRAMVINHESGHWFGFYHSYCGGAGQLAPVMQQQSIDLQGCVFNPWPLASEQAALKSQLGL